LLMQSASAVRQQEASLGTNPIRRSVSGSSFRERLRDFFSLRAMVFGSAAAGLAAAAMIVAVWFGLDNQQLRTELTRSESQRTSLAARLQAEARMPKSNPGHAATALPEPGMRVAPLAFVLSPGITRGDGGTQKRLVIPADGVDRVRFNLDFTPFEQYTSYRVVVSAADGGEVSGQDIAGEAFRGAGSKLVLDLPAVSLPEGNYIIVVKGRLGAAAYEDLESYYFHVVRSHSQFPIRKNGAQ
jgi:hypothetical protein